MIAQARRHAKMMDPYTCIMRDGSMIILHTQRTAYHFWHSDGYEFSVSQMSPDPVVRTVGQGAFFAVEPTYLDD